MPPGVRRRVVPLSVPPLNVSVGIDCADALLMERVPPESESGVLIVPLTVFVPDCHCVVPAPLIVDAASKVCASEVLKMMFVPEAALNVAPVLATAPT